MFGIVNADSLFVADHIEQMMQIVGRREELHIAHKGKTVFQQLLPQRQVDTLLQAVEIQRHMAGTLQQTLNGRSVSIIHG